jgi:hypothetical protein
LNLWCTQNQCSPKIYCGSELAREGGKSGNEQVSV